MSLITLNCSFLFGRDSGQAGDAFKLLKVFVEGKGLFQFKRPHDRKTGAVGETEIHVIHFFHRDRHHALMSRP